MEAAPIRRLGAHGAHAGLGIGGGADIGKEHILDAGAERADCEVVARLLLDLHHAGEVVED
jgi:hypothetical protein